MPSRTARGLGPANFKKGLDKRSVKMIRPSEQNWGGFVEDSDESADKGIEF